MLDVFHCNSTLAKNDNISFAKSPGAHIRLHKQVEQQLLSCPLRKRKQVKLKKSSCLRKYLEELLGPLMKYSQKCFAAKLLQVKFCTEIAK